jgi:WD40 repeat protein
MTLDEKGNMVSQNTSESGENKKVEGDNSGQSTAVTRSMISLILLSTLLISSFFYTTAAKEISIQ